MTTALATLWRILGIRGAIAVALGLALAFTAWRADVLQGRLERARDQIAAMEVAQEAARAAQQAVNDAAATRYQELAERADDDTLQAQATALDAATRYIRDNRVQPCGTSLPTETTASAPDSDPGIPASLPADSFVAVSPADVRACTAATTYAIEAHRWANSLNSE